MSPIPRDREECSICLHPRDDHLPHCVFSSHEVDVHWIREKYKTNGESEEAYGQAGA